VSPPSVASIDLTAATADAGGQATLSRAHRSTTAMRPLGAECITTFSQPGGLDGAINSLLLEAGSLYVGGSFWTHRDTLATFFAVLDLASGAHPDVGGF
jgi:hypothetical protein